MPEQETTASRGFAPPVAIGSPHRAGPLPTPRITDMRSPSPFAVLLGSRQAAPLLLYGLAAAGLLASPAGAAALTCAKRLGWKAGDRVVIIRIDDGGMSHD